MAGAKPAAQDSPGDSPPAHRPCSARHRASLMPYGAHNPALLRLVSQRPTLDMITYIAQQTVQSIPCANQEPKSDLSAPPVSELPAPPVTPDKTVTSIKRISLPSRMIPALEHFILHLVKVSNVQVPTLLATLVYLDRLSKVIPPMTEGIACSRHRVFLATLVVAAKFLNDCSPRNHVWAQYAVLFDVEEINLMERQLLCLLEFQLRFDESEACRYFAPFMHHYRPLPSPPSSLLVRLEAVEKVTRAGMKRAEEAGIQLPLMPLDGSPRIVPAIASATRISASSSFALRAPGPYVPASVSSASLAPAKKPVYTNVHLSVPRFSSSNSSYTPKSSSSSPSSGHSGFLSSASAESFMDPSSSVSSFSSIDAVASHHNHSLCDSHSKPFVLRPVPPHAFRHHRRRVQAETELDETAPPSPLRTAARSAPRRPPTPAFGGRGSISVDPPTPALTRSPTPRSATPPTSGGPVTPHFMSARLPNLSAYARHVHASPTPGIARAVSEICVSGHGAGERGREAEEGAMFWRNSLRDSSGSKYGEFLKAPRLQTRRDNLSTPFSTSTSASASFPSAPSKFLTRMWSRGFKSPIGDLKLKTHRRTAAKLALGSTPASPSSLSGSGSRGRSTSRKERSPSSGKPVPGWLKVPRSPLPSFQRAKGRTRSPPVVVQPRERVFSRGAGIPASGSYAQGC